MLVEEFAQYIGLMWMVIWSLCFISTSQFFQNLYKLEISPHCPKFCTGQHLTDNNLEENNISAN